MHFNKYFIGRSLKVARFSWYFPLAITNIKVAISVTIFRVRISFSIKLMCTEQQLQVSAEQFICTRKACYSTDSQKVFIVTFIVSANSTGGCAIHLNEVSN